MIRLFAGIEIPDDVQDALMALERPIAGARWVEAANLHLTLRFIGDIDERTAAAVDAALEQVRGTPFALSLAGLGTFGEGRRLHTLWAGVRPSEPLAILQGRTEAACRRAGLAPETRKFTPHVTVARLKAPPEEAIARLLAGEALFAAGPFPVTRFVLYSSHAVDGGRHYEPERLYDL